MSWADRIAAILAAFLALVGLAMCGGWNLDGRAYTSWLELVAVLVGGLWLFLRFVDAVCGGPTRRADRRPGRPWS
jgi:hypothetical protein